MKTLSIKAEFAFYVCAGIKKIEYRSRTTNLRGRILIHSSGDGGFFVLPPHHERPSLSPTFDEFGDRYDDKTGEVTVKGGERYFMADDSGKVTLNKNANDYLLFKYGWDRCNAGKIGFPSQSIIGSVEIVDSVKNGEQDYQWILKNPILFENPFNEIRGKLGMWDWTPPPRALFTPYGARDNG
jgi:hypothetical protein